VLEHYTFPFVRIISFLYRTSKRVYMIHNGLGKKKKTVKKDESAVICVQIPKFSTRHY
jgi:hypothetical protein